MVGTQFVFAFSGAVDGTREARGRGAGEGDGDGDGDGYLDNGDDEHDEYANAPGLSSVALEGPQKPKKKGKAAKN